MQLQAKKSHKLYRHERKAARGKHFVFGEAQALADFAGDDIEYEPIDQSICRYAISTTTIVAKLCAIPPPPPQISAHASER